MANFVLSGDPAPAKTCYCIQVFWCFVLPDVSLLAAVGRFLDDFWRMRFCYLHVYPGFLALCTSCDLLIKSIFAAILYVSSVNGILLDPFWLLFTRFLRHLGELGEHRGHGGLPSLSTFLVWKCLQKKLCFFQKTLRLCVKVDPKVLRLLRKRTK